MTIFKIKDILKGEWAMSPPQYDTAIEHLLTDSRRIAFPTSSAFWAIRGERHNGHDFIYDAYQKGVRSFIISDIQKIDTRVLQGAYCIVVPHVLRGLQRLAAYHRSQFPDLQVIGITGSNGKTIVKEWLYQLLRDDFNIVRSPKSYNSQVGVPLSVWQIKASHNLAIFEAGISTVQEMAHLEPIIQPNIGVFTNIGTAHTEGFVSDAEKVKEKMGLFKNVDMLITSKKLVDNYKVMHTKLLTWGMGSEKGDVWISNMRYLKNSTELTIVFQAQEWTLEIPFKDNASIENVITCLSAILALNPQYFKSEILFQRFKKLEPVAMRLELKAGINGCLVVNDAYNLDFNALQLALDFITQQSRQLRRTLILSDILQSGQEGSVLYTQVAALIHEKGITQFIGIGEEVQALKAFLTDIQTQFFKTTSDFLKEIKNSDFQNEIILLKGARQFEFERIAERLAQKSHKTVLEINLNALVHNLAYFKSLLPPTTRLMAMVKASAYGNGSDEIARLLEFHKVDYLAVAYSDEGVQLRQAGVNLPIMVMNPEEESFDAARRYHLEPEIYSLRILKNYIDFVENIEGIGREEKYKIHVKLDTGMHRLGFELKDIPEFLNLIKECEKIEIASVFTHLAGTDSSEFDGFTKEQVRQYEALYALITEGVGYRPIRHVLNSSGITRHPDFYFDMVRLGIGLYGVDSHGAFQNHLEVVQTLKASISQIKNIPQNETIGYSRRGILNRDSRIATISIGYADGLSRLLGNGGWSVYVRGKRAPIIGNVCMDMTMIDITDIPDAEEGEEVEIFGNNILVQDLAHKAQTIPYEIFTSISERVKRVYFQE